MYTLYVGNFDKATETLSTWMKKSAAMTAVIEEIQVEGIFSIAHSVKSCTYHLLPRGSTPTGTQGNGTVLVFLLFPAGVRGLV